MLNRPRALTAVTRFGLGPRTGEIDDIAHDPVGFVHDQCMAPKAAIISYPGIQSRNGLLDSYIPMFRESRRARREARRNGTSAEAEQRAQMAIRERRDLTRDILRQEIKARVAHGVVTDHPFVERLVLFWSNHFAVERKRSPLTRAFVGNFERNAIRSNVLGYFEDMLLAATTHPAMLTYLDNTRNIGPNSAAGQRRKVKAVNENLAREVLELHTLGAGGGYTQEDVIELANALTGWTGGVDLAHDGVFFARFHEAGDRTILGKRYSDRGADQIRAILPDLARHPSTAKHIAAKFAQHFVADDVSPALIQELETAFLETEGDLRELALVLVESDHAWVDEPKKTVPPYDFMVSAMRATDSPVPSGHQLARTTQSLAQGVWEPPSPAGWPSNDRAFLGGDSLLERVDYSKALASRIGGVGRVQDLAVDLFGDALDPFVAEAVARAEDQRQALVLLLMSPAFHRR
ncbi:MAG: DUF1800 domain-containing protein [Pseudomonadota bacterium]